MHGKDTSLGFQMAQCKSALLIWKTLWKTLITRRYIFSLYSSLYFHLTMIKLRNEFQTELNAIKRFGRFEVQCFKIQYSDICFDVLTLELHKTEKNYQVFWNTFVLVDVEVWCFKIQYSDICFDVLTLELRKTEKNCFGKSIFFAQYKANERKKKHVVFDIQTLTNCRVIDVQPLLFFSCFFQLLKEFQMTKPQLQYYIRLWSRQDTESINLNEWIALLHNAGKNGIF